MERRVVVGGIARGMYLTDKGRAALALEAAGLELPDDYPCWGAPDSPLCPNGHVRRGTEQCRPCAVAAGYQRRRAKAKAAVVGSVNGCGGLTQCWAQVVALELPR